MFKSLAIITRPEVFALACETDLKSTSVERPKLTEKSCLSKPEMSGCSAFIDSLLHRHLRSVLLLAGLMLLLGCKADLKVETNVADLDCAVLIDDTYCIKVRNGQINSVKDLAFVHDRILTSESGFNLRWKMPETAKGILATKIMLASDAACTTELQTAEVEISQQAYTFTDVKDGIYYACVFAKARAAGLLGAHNNGLSVLVETAKPKIESPSVVFYTNGSVLKQSPKIAALSVVKSQWTQISGPGKLTFTDTDADAPTIIASVDGIYTFSLTAMNEVGGTSTKTFTLVYDSRPPVLKDIAPIVTSASSIAIQAESDEDLQLYRWEIISAPAGVTPDLKDANAATAELSLPSLGSYELKVSLSDQAGNIGSTRVLITKEAPAAAPVDTTHPSAPSAITVAAYSTATSVSVSYTAGSDANFSTHNVKACAASDCSTACLSVSQDIASPVTVSSLLNGSSYYICLQAVDLSGNTSAYAASANSVTVDTMAPLAPSALGFGSSYTTSTTLSLAFAPGTDTNFSTHDTRLCTASDCTTGCGSTVQSATSPVSLSGAAGTTYYGCARSRDLAGNTSSWIASIGTMTIDSTNPTAPSAITVAPYANATSVQATYTAGTDLNFVTHHVKACMASDCSTGCLSVTQDLASPVTVASLVPGSSYWICLQSVDQANNTSAFVASGNSVTIDTSNPTAPSTLAWAASYSNSATAALSWTNGSDSNFSTHNLKACTDSACLTSCTSVTQDAASPGSIGGMTAGSSYYACLQTVDLAGNSSAFVASASPSTIDTTNPTLPTGITVASYSNATTVDVTYSAGTDINFSTHNVKACTASDCSTGCLSATQDLASPVTVASLVNGTAYSICLQTVDLAANTSTFVASGNAVMVDTTSPAAPAAMAWASAYSSSTTVDLSWTNGTDTNFSTHNLKACTDSGCSTACTSVTQDNTTPGSISGMSAGTSYYACLQTVDLAGNTSAYVASAATTTIDTTNPAVPSAITVAPYNNATSVNVTYTSGTDANFSTHNVKACTANDCTTGCLSTSQDPASPVTVASLVSGTAYYICLQTVDLAANVSAYIPSGNPVLIDTTNPAVPAAISWAGAYSNSTTSALTWTNGTDTNFSTHNLKACTDSGCSTACTAVTQDNATPGSISGMSPGSSYYACVQTVDLVGNSSAYVASAAPTLIDTTNPAVPAAITVATYSNSTSPSVTYTAGTDTNFLTHNVKACTANDCTTGCLIPFLDAASPVTVASLVTGTAYFICLQTRDLASNFSAYVASGNSVTIDTTSPAAPSSLGFSAAYTTSTTLSLAFAVGTDTNFATHDTKLCAAPDCSTGCGNVVQSAASPVALTGSAGSAYYGCARTVDLAGNTSAWVSSLGTMTIDATNPTAPSGITVASHFNNTATDVPVTYTAGTDANFATHNVKACTASDCSTGCLSVTQDVASPVGVSSLVNGTSYWICLQTVDQANNLSAYVPSGNSVRIDTSNPAAPAAPAFAASYTAAASAAITWTNGTDTNFSTHNLKACTDSGCSVSCVASAADSASPGSLTGLNDGTIYYACVQSVDLAGNTSAFVASAGTTRIDTTNPGLPTAVSFSNLFQLAFTAGTEINPSSFNLKACTDSGCSSGCVGSTTTAASPGQISGAAMTVSTAYYGCVQGTDLAGNSSAFAASAATATRHPYTVTYDANNSTGGSVPSDPLTYANSHTVTVLGNTGSLVKAGSVFAGWNTMANGAGNSYTAGQTLVMGSANVTLYAQWTFNCSSLAGGTWVLVPGGYGKAAFCVQKYAASDIGGVPTAAAGWEPWVNIDQTSARSTCSSLGTGYHLLTNPEWMAIAANIANVGSNWSGGSVGSGSLRRGHGDNVPSYPCQADYVDADAYVEAGDCIGTNSGAFSERRTSFLSNGAVIWDIGGNVWNWIDYTLERDALLMPTGSNWHEYTAITASRSTRKADLIPRNQGQSWWNDAWNSAQGIGRIRIGWGSGSMLRGGMWSDTTRNGAFASFLAHYYYESNTTIGFRCAWQGVDRVTYNSNGANLGSAPSDTSQYASGDTVTVVGNTGSLLRDGYSFAGWNTQANGLGTSYSPGNTFAIGTGNLTLYAQWTLSCDHIQGGGTWVAVPGDYGTPAFCVQKYAASNVNGVAKSQAGTAPWVNINQTSAIAACSELGAGYHLITNPEWMTVAANLANVGSNWSGGTVGSGTLRRGHTDSNPNSACAANASDTNAFVETNCVGSSSGNFVERRTSTLSNGSVVWDIGGNVWSWTNYFNSADKPTPSISAWHEFTAITGSTMTPKSHLVPLNSVQPWWSDTWSSAQGIGMINPSTNGTGGALLRGSLWVNGSTAGPFAVTMNYAASGQYTEVGFRCAWQAPARVTYAASGSILGSVPSDPASYTAGDTVTVLGNTGNLTKPNYSFEGWTNPATGTTYTAGQTFTMSTADVTLYPKWILNSCSGLAGGTWVLVPGDSIYGTSPFCVQKYAPSDVSGVPTSQTGTVPWTSIDHPTSIAKCASLGTGYHLITNPEWMTVATNLANVGSNWSGVAVGSGTLRRGHSDTNPNAKCAANASDANAFVEIDCTGTSSGNFVERRTSTLSTGSVIWDIGGNVWNWVNYFNSSDKPTPASSSWYEFSAITWTSSTPRSHILPLNSTQSWWNDSWTSAQGIGQMYPGTSGTGGALLRGADHIDWAQAGLFTARLAYGPSTVDPKVGFRCAYTPISSCNDLLNAGFTTSGIYTIAPGGTAMQAYCDMTTDNGGWTLIASSVGANRGFNTVSSLTSTSSYGMLPQTVVTNIAKASTAVRITSADGRRMHSIDSYPISRVQSFLHITDAAGVDPSIHWRGDGLQNEDLAVYCNDAGSAALNTLVYMACGNVWGMHWIPSDNPTWNLTDGPAQDMKLWVK